MLFSGTILRLSSGSTSAHGPHDGRRKNRILLSKPLQILIDLCICDETGIENRAAKLFDIGPKHLRSGRSPTPHKRPPLSRDLG